MGLFERSYMHYTGDAASSKAMIKKLIIVNVAIYLATLAFPELKDHLILSMDSLKHFQLYRIVTAAFLHLDFWHIVLNMWGLYLFGSVAAPYLSGKHVFWLYMLGGVLGNLAFVAFNWYHAVSILGASGAVYAITIAAAMLEPELKFVVIFMPFRPIKTSTMVLVFTVIEILSLLSSGDGVAHLAHLGGFVAGYLYMKFGKLPYTWDPLKKILPKRGPGRDHFDDSSKKYDKKDYRTCDHSYAAPDTPIPQQEVDRLLDKISATGINSLSEEELATLRKIREQMNHPGR